MKFLLLLLALTGTANAAKQVNTADIANLAVTNPKIANSTIDLTTKVTGVLPVANGGSGTSTAFTVGSVLFAGSSGVYSQDNSNFFYDATNKRLGIGTASPISKLEVQNPTSGTVERLLYVTNNNITSGASNIRSVFLAVGNGAAYATGYAVLGAQMGNSSYQSYFVMDSSSIQPQQALLFKNNVALASYSSTNAFVPLVKLNASNTAEIGPNYPAAYDLKFYIGSTAAKYQFMNASASSTALMTLLGTGNVGIGTTSPTRQLHVVGQFYQQNRTGQDGNDGSGFLSADGTRRLFLYTVPSYAAIQAENGARLDFVQTDATKTINFWGGASGSTRQVTIDSNTGNVGVGTASPGSTLHVAGSYQGVVNSLSTNTTLDGTHNILRVDATSGTVTLTLPAASSSIIGRTYRIKKIDSSANSVTVARTGSDTIDGATSASLTSQYQSFDIICLTSTTWGIF